jgi:propanol-preferring alcohol dehydrogenase
VKLDASIIFAPAGELVPVALNALDRGGRLVLAGIHMTDIPQMEYRALYGERIVRSVSNNTRDDGHGFLEEAARIPVQIHANQYPLSRADQALRDLKHDAIAGAAVLVT